MLRGRRAECDTLDRLLADARAGQSRVLVLRGEAGVGKTALLDYLVGRATSCRLERAAGVEPETELAYAGLHQLCAPLLDRRDRLPEPQRDALATAFGLAAGDPPDAFLIGLGVLGLLADAAEERPLICVVDDAQWLDRMSAVILEFVARRLQAESVGLVFAARTGVGTDLLAGVPELVVDGLADADAHALLDSVLTAPVDDLIRDRIVAETRGNPLALLELPRGRTPAELAFGFGPADATPLVSRIEQGFVRRIGPLPADTRLLLLTAAVEPVGDVTRLWRAADRLGVEPDAAAPAVDDGLLELGARVRFRHPLVRSAAWRAADPADLRRVHGALAEVTDARAEPDRRAWHRAHAAVGPDEEVAGELERSAGRALARGGRAAAAAFLERAVELTAVPELRGSRSLAAASARFDAGQLDLVPELLATAELAPLDALQRARLERLRARVASRHRGDDAPALLLAAAERLGPLDPAAARETYLEAVGAAVDIGQDVATTAEAALKAPAPPDPPRPIDLLLDGLTARWTSGYADAVPLLRRALNGFTDPDDLRWLWLVSPVAHELFDDPAWHDLTAQAVGHARESRALTVLPDALVFRAGAHLFAGEFGAAAALIGEAYGIRAATGHAPRAGAALLLAAYRDAEPEALELIAPAARGDGRTAAQARLAMATLYNGHSRYTKAADAALEAAAHDDLGIATWVLPELVEAAVRAGRADVAAEARRRLEERTGPAGTPWAAGAAALARALVTGDEDAYREALDRLAATRLVLPLTRARLLYGEWLRRSNRRSDARDQLRAAHDAFAAMGAAGFTERARRELQATGETVRRRTVEAHDEFTPQEAQIARLAADGRTNPEIGAELFLSPRTVEWHLRKVFAKLGITSRRELRAVLRATQS